ITGGTEYHGQELGSSFRHHATPMVVRLHTPAFVCRQLNGLASGAGGYDTVLSEQAESWKARRATLLTSPSSALARKVARQWRLDGSAMRVIPNPVDEELFHANGSPRPPKVLFVGRLERRKGVQTLIEAWPAIHAAVPDARAMLVGADHASGPNGGSMKAHLQQSLGMV